MASESIFHTPYVVKDGRLTFKYHDGQRRAIRSQKRIILVLAGTQGGKTSFAPWWLMREMRKKGPGDYLFVTPTFTLLEKKALPEFQRLFQKRCGLGLYVGGSKKTFTLSPKGERALWGKVFEEPSHVFFGHATDSDSLESMTAKAAVLDEAGQKKFKPSSWEAIQRRLAIHQGRVLMTTTPYYLGWLKNEVHDKFRKDPEIDLIQFESIMNPAFPREEFERQRGKLPSWKFNMMYRGLFERPAGMIFDCWDPKEHKMPRFAVPSEWRRYVGLDFGGVNTAAVFLAEEPDTKRFYIYRIYLAGSRTAKEHAELIRKGEPVFQRAVGGSHSEDQWRNEFRQGGLVVGAPEVKEVEVGIDRVYDLLKNRRLFVFDDLADLIDEIESYSRVLDDGGEPTEKIEDKETYHRLDALRYIVSFINRKSHRFGMGMAE